MAGPGQFYKPYRQPTQRQHLLRRDYGRRQSRNAHAYATPAGHGRKAAAVLPMVSRMKAKIIGRANFQPHRVDGDRGTCPHRF